MSLARRLEVDLAQVFGTVGVVVLVLGLAQLVPALVAVVTRAPAGALAAGALGTIAVGGALLPLRARARKATRRESLATVTVAWLAASLASAVPFVAAGACGGVDALFEAVSGLTTTGGTVFVDVDRMLLVAGAPGDPVPPLAPALHLWRAITHWLGGAGIVLVVLVLTPFLADAEGLRRTQRTESSLLTERYRGSTRATVKGLLSVYVGATLAQVLLLWALGLSLWDAILHSFATIATGGFSNRTASLATWGPAVQLVTMAFMVLGALNFAVLGRAAEELRSTAAREARAIGLARAGLAALLRAPGVTARALWRSGEARGYLLLVAGACLLLTLVLFLSGDPARYTGGAGAWRAFVDATFNVGTISSTTGFCTEDFTRWPAACQVVLLVLMLIGGCGGSTAGGIKFRRVQVCFKYAVRETRRFTHPRAVLPIRIGEEVVPDEQVREALGFATTYVGIALLVTLALALSGAEPATSGGAAAATMASVGPGFGACGPAGSYQGFAAWAKLVLVFSMLVGRLDVFPLLTVCLPSFWVRRGR